MVGATLSRMSEWFTSGLAALVLGALIGAALTWFTVVAGLRERLARAAGESELLRERVTDLEGAASQDRELAATLSPLAGALARVEHQVAGLERDRVAQYSRLGEQIEAVRLSGEALRVQTSALAGALRAPTSRGAWGEVQLRRVVEHAGMLARVDFSTQAHGTRPDGASVRPDLVVHLPGGKHVVVDAKAPLAAFLEASEGADDAGAAGRQRRGRRCACPGPAHPCRRPGRQGVLARLRPEPGAGHLLRARGGLPGLGLLGRPQPARARDGPAGGSGHPDHAARPAAHDRADLADRRADRQRPGDLHHRPGALRPAGHPRRAHLPARQDPGARGGGLQRPGRHPGAPGPGHRAPAARPRPDRRRPGGGGTTRRGPPPAHRSRADRRRLSRRLRCPDRPGGRSDASEVSERRRP